MIVAAVIPQPLVGVEGITEIEPGLGSQVNQPLESLMITYPDDFAAQETACLAIDQRQDVDLVFLSPIKVNNSSISACSTFLGMGVLGILPA